MSIYQRRRPKRIASLRARIRLKKLFARAKSEGTRLATYEGRRLARGAVRHGLSQVGRSFF